MRSVACGILLALIWVSLLPNTVFAQSSISINDITVTEGQSGNTIATFTVSRSVSGAAASVLFSTSNGTATGGGSCGAGIDYISLSSNLAFAANESKKTVVIYICGDVLDEADETFMMNLSAPTGAAIADSQGQVTIIDDDPVPYLRINDISVPEANLGYRDAAFTITLSAASGREITGRFTTGSGSATGGTSCDGQADYISRSSSGFKIRVGAVSQTIGILICGDEVLEGNESSTVNLSSVNNATIFDGEGVFNILNDDLPLLRINDAFVTEPSSAGQLVNARFELSLSTGNRSSASVHFTILDGTAVRSGTRVCDGVGDFILRGGVIEFRADQDMQVISVPICHDSVHEKTETFQIRFSSPTGMTLQDAVAVGTIFDND